MKKLWFMLFCLFATPVTITSLDENLKATLEMQVEQLKYMLTKSNDAYIQNIPMYDQPLTSHWYLAYFLPFRFIEGQYAYNSEVLLEESKKLTDVIFAIEQLQESDTDYNYQVHQLIRKLIHSNDAYINSTPMYKQSLNLQWYGQYFVPLLRHMQGEHFYNSEIALTESKKLASVILAMSKFKKS